tara:strand:- start:179 stop:448 length:270 start_codon:yes stop_codon:yes gene_type:complete
MTTLRFEEAFHKAVTIPGERIVPPDEQNEAIFDWTIKHFQNVEDEHQTEIGELNEEHDEKLSELEKDKAWLAGEVESLENFIKMLGVKR